MSHTLIKHNLLKRVVKDFHAPNEIEQAFLDQFKVLHLIDETLVSYSKGQINGYEGMSKIREHMNRYL